MANGIIIIGSLWKHSASLSSNSHCCLSLPVLALCPLIFLYFSSNFVHLLEHCPLVTLTDELNRGSEWDFGSEKGIILIALFWLINNCVRNVGKVKPQTWTP